MKGLVRKDLYIIGRNLKVLVLLMVVFGSVSLVGEGSTFLLCWITIFGALVSTAPISYDRQAGWDKFEAALPVTRREMVLSKYISAGLITMGSVVVCLLFWGAGAVFSRRPPDIEMLAVLLLSFAAAVVIVCVMLPLSLKFGNEKGRLILALSAGIIGAVVMSFVTVTNGELFLPDVHLFLPALVVIALLCLVAAVFISFFCSLHVMTKKEY